MDIVQCIHKPKAPIHDTTASTLDITSSLAAPGGIDYTSSIKTKITFQISSPAFSTPTSVI